MITVTVDRVEAVQDDEQKSTEDTRVGKTPKTSAARTRKEATPVLQAPEKGYCIRCKADLPANPTQPYCSRCIMRVGGDSRNKEYEEKRCHTCGNEHAATLLKKPLCPDLLREIQGCSGVRSRLVLR